MAFYTYVSNVSPSDGFDRIDILLDNGQKTTIRRGSSYDLSANEVARARRYAVMVSSTDGVAPELVSYLPIKGSMANGQVPVWSEADAAFVPGSGGGGTGDGNAKVLRWDGTAGAYDHPEWWGDTSEPREFRGPNDPSTEAGITMGFADTWEPTDVP
jgi:hypothetical protein